MTEVAPWLVPASEGTAAPAGNIAPWLQDQPGYAEDMAKSAAPSLARGVIAIPGTPGDLSHLAKAGADKVMEKVGAPDPLGWLTHKLDENFPNAMKFVRDSNAKSANVPAAQTGSGDLPGSYEMPTSKDIQGQVEKVTGPFYEAKTGPGKALSTTLEVGPSMATGGGPVRGLLAKAVGAGVTSELAGEGANAIKDKLPDSVQPYVEPVARALGTLGGTAIPSLLRRARTPLPMSDDQYAIVQALKQTAPELAEASTAGQLTESPRLMGIESRTKLGQNAASEQERAFTKAALRQGGVYGDFSNIGEGDKVGQELGALRRSNTMDLPHLKDLNKDVGLARRDLQRVVGKGNTKSMDEVQNNIKFGAMNNGTPVLSIPGARYEYLREDLQKRIEAAGSSQEKQALSKSREALDKRFKGSAPTDQAARLTDLERQYANWNVLKDIPPKPGMDTITPQQVKSSVGHNWGNAAANTGRGDLAPLADNASHVMTPHGALPDKTKVGPMTDLISSILMGAIQGGGAEAAGAGHGLSALIGSEGTVAGHLLAPAIYHGVADLGAKALSSRPVQSYLGNQAWRPGPGSTAPDRELLLRLLMSPQAHNAVAGPQ